MSRKIKTQRARRQVQTARSAAGGDQELWRRITQEAGDRIVAQVNEQVERGQAFETLAILAGPGAVLAQLMHNWPAARSMAAVVVVVALADLRALANRLNLSPGTRTQLAEELPAGSLHGMALLPHEQGLPDVRVIVCVQAIRMTDRPPTQATVDPEFFRMAWTSSPPVASPNPEQARVIRAMLAPLLEAGADVAKLALLVSDGRHVARGAAWVPRKTLLEVVTTWSEVLATTDTPGYLRMTGAWLGLLAESPEPVIFAVFSDEMFLTTLCLPADPAAC